MGRGRERENGQTKSQEETDEERDRKTATVRQSKTGRDIKEIGSEKQELRNSVPVHAHTRVVPSVCM